MPFLTFKDHFDLWLEPLSEFKYCSQTIYETLIPKKPNLLEDPKQNKACLTFLVSCPENSVSQIDYID